MAFMMNTMGAELAPSLVIFNVRVRTMEGIGAPTFSPPAKSSSQGVAVMGDRIVAVGESGRIREMAGPETRVVDGKGGLLLPGFNDAHVHFLSGGFAVTNVDLRDAKSPEEMASRLGKYAKRLPKGRWILGGEWDHENWPGAPWPTKEMIDAATPDHPVLVSRLDGHMSLANSLALKLAGLTAGSVDPPGGLIVREPGGEPTGLLKDSAADLVQKVVPPRTTEEKLEAARAATAEAARVGVTSVTDVSADEDVGLYQLMAARGEIKTRIYAVRSIMSWRALGDLGVRAGFGSDLIRIGGLKGFSDGSLGSTTARFFAPYADRPDTRGLWFEQMFPEGAMRERVLEADRRGLQVMIHAIGDEANAAILDLYSEVARSNGQRDRRFRIEHAQHLRQEDVTRFGSDRVVASMQPYHAADDGRWCEKRIGRERCRGTYAFRSLLDAGAVLAFGSDWTVAPLNPLLGIKAAVTRQTLDGKNPGGWVPEEKITVEEAVRAYTVGSAYAEFQDDVKGTVTVGKLADLALLDRDIFDVPPEQIDQARVVVTVVGGRVVFEKL